MIELLPRNVRTSRQAQRATRTRNEDGKFSLMMRLLLPAVLADAAPGPQRLGPHSGSLRGLRTAA
jgi:hypothetical protein